MNDSNESILFVIPTAIIGGAERVMFNLAAYLLEQGKSVTVLTMSRGWKVDGWNELKKYSKFKWIIGTYSSEKASLIPTTVKLIHLDAKYKFDYIFSSHVHVNSYISQLKRLGLFKNSVLISRESFAVFETHTDYKGILFKQAYRHLYGEQDLLICQTKLMKNSLVKNLGFKPARKIEVIPNPVNLDYIKSNINSTAKDKTIVACGRLIKVKQIDVLINAFYQFSKVHPEYNLVILGDGVLRASLEAQISRLDLSNKVVLKGNIRNPFELFAKSEIGVIASQREGFPNVLLEMMASGTSKIVTTPCTGGLHDIPNLILTDDTSMESILEGLNKAAESNSDHSAIYQTYIAESHSVPVFWNKVKNLVKS